MNKSSKTNQQLLFDDEVEELRTRLDVAQQPLQEANGTSCVLEKSGRHLSGEGGASEILVLKRTTPQSRIRKLGIKRPAH